MIANIQVILTSPIIILLLLCFVLLTVFINISRKKRNAPPGPKGIPLLGNTYLFKPVAYKILDKLTKQYGPIYEFKFFGQPIIVLGNYEVIKEAFLKNGKIFSGRPKSFIFQWYSDNYHGIFFSNGKLWKEQKRFAGATLKEFGIGKSILEDRIIQESQFVIKEIKGENGEPFDPQMLFCKAVSNIILSLTCNKRIDYDDETYENLLKNFEKINIGFRMTNPINFLPVLRFFLKSWQEFATSITEVKNFLHDIIKDHEQHYDANNKQDYIDAYLENKYKMENSNANNTFTNLQLIATISDFFLAGTDSTTTTLMWAILYLVHYPNVQEKIHHEIDSVIGAFRSPTLKDKEKLPFTEATIMEILRHSNMLPLSIAHTTIQDFNLLGYDIPKGSFVIPNMTAVNFDSKYWQDPYNFNPRRFLNADGSVKTNIESYLPFSLGYRACLGESLAKMELFLFLVSLLQRFIIKSRVNGYLPSMTACIDGIMLHPLRFKICADAR